jgi:hypothetical protein
MSTRTVPPLPIDGSDVILLWITLPPRNRQRHVWLLGHLLARQLLASRASREGGYDAARAD